MLEIILFSIFALLQLGDVVTTKIVLENGGREVNPLARWMIEHTPNIWVALLPPKAVITVLTYLFLLESPILLGLMCAMMAYVVYHNYGVYKILKSRQDA